jgi:hypothetical protein
MFHAEVEFPAYVGVAPGTTTITYDGASGLGAVPAYPTQAWDIPQDAYSEAVKIAVPPCQFLPRIGYPLPRNPLQAWVQWPLVNDRVQIVVPPNQIAAGAVKEDLPVQAAVPAIQRTFGPFPNDYMAVPTVNYLPYRKGWIHHNAGDIFTLQGGLAGALGAELPVSNGVRKWAIFSSVLSALALATTTTLAVLEFRRRGR